jgi:hypothetical protein
MIVIAALTVPLSAEAGTASGGIATLEMTGDRMVVDLVAAESAAPRCNTAHRFVANTTTAHGRALMAAIMTAHRNGLDITAVGAGQCSLVAGAEDLRAVAVTVPASEQP